VAVPSDLSGPPSRDTAVPRSLGFLEGAVPVWLNSLGGLTFSGTLRGEPVFAKWSPLGFSDEIARLRWAAPFAPVPSVVAFGDDFLVTRALPGQSAVGKRWSEHPEAAVAALGAGLRALHDALPVRDCPFDWSVESRVARAGVAAVEAPPIDLLVVCHGDACAPNTLIADDGSWAAHVDLGSLGVADRWADIAVGAMSTEWNYGPGWEDTYLRAYGIAPDPLRMSFYRDLWNRT
jgi:kanamycin kinase